MLMRAVAGDPLDVDLLDLGRAGRLENLGVAIDQEPALGKVVRVGLEGDPGDRQAPRIRHPLIEVDTVLVLGHVVDDHRDRHAVVEIVAIDSLRLGAPGWPAGEAPVDRQWDPDPCGGDVAAADVATRVVVLVELEAAGAHVAAAGPGVDRIVEHADGGAVFVERDVPPDQVAAVGQSIGEPSGSRQEEQSSRLDRAAGEDDDVGFLLEEIAVGILVHDALGAPIAIERDLANVAVRAQLAPTGLEGIGNEDVERARPRARRVTVLLGERTDDGRGAAVERPRQRGLRRRKRVPAEVRAANTELLGIP